MDAASRLNVPWFESPFFERQLERSDLDEPMRELVRSFAERGYVVIELDRPDFERTAVEIDRRLEDEFAAAGNRVQDGWIYVPAVRDIATDETVLRTLEALYRRRPVPFQTLNFKRGTQQATHSDLVHFNSIPPRYMAGVWVALEDVRPESGPLHYYPGSQTLPVFELHDLDMAGSSSVNRDQKYALYEQFMHELIEQSGLPKETVSLKRGQALIWAANLLHGGEPIADPASTRRSQVTHYYFEGCRYYTPLHSDPPLGRYAWRRVVDIRTGEAQPHVYAGRTVRLPARTNLRSAATQRIRGSSAGRRALRSLRSRMRRG
jgi:Phytanoyl-CoA dioxygenase (PhyH)